ncbi:MAG: hypothetical protein II674_07570 [Prevotella sp.]|nr:hypothetical protein [Prevotella sp.]
MKRIVFCFMAMMISMAMMAQGRCLMSITDNDGYSNVRKGMTTKSVIVKKVIKGTEVYVTPTGTNWYRVSLSPNGAFVGYIHNSCVGMGDNFATLYKVTDKDGYTNVRQQATTKSAIVKKMRTGEEFEGVAVYVNGEFSNWVGVLDENQHLIGFVYNTNVLAIAQ